MRKYRRLSAICGTSLLILLWSGVLCSSNAANDDDINKPIISLSQALQARTDGKFVFFDALSKLQKQIDVFLGHPSESYVKERADSLALQLNSEGLDSENTTLRPSLQTLQKTLREKLFSARVTYFIEWLSSLTTELNSAGSIVQQDQRVQTAAVKLNLELQKIHVLDPNENAATVAKSLTAILKENPPTTFKSSEKELRGLQAVLNATLAPYRPLIYILAATYGDIRPDSRRSCAATDYLKSLCHGKANCVLTGFSNTQACGYDPVPFVEARYKAVVITYICVPGRLNVWEDDINVKQFRRHTAKLRTNTDTFVCSN